MTWCFVLDSERWKFFCSDDCNKFWGTWFSTPQRLKERLRGKLSLRVSHMDSYNGQKDTEKRSKSEKFVHWTWLIFIGPWRRRSHATKHLFLILILLLIHLIYSSVLITIFTILKSTKLNGTLFKLLSIYFCNSFFLSSYSRRKFIKSTI